MSTTKGKSIATGPYRATKLWNDAVRSFYNEMPLSRHWRGLKQYDSCFTASEAIDWLHDYLRSNPNFGQNVIREQATKLLRKFVKCGLIIGARGTKIYAEDFRDNRELY
ncbi:DEP domain-containing protein 1A, partial [Armadillidium nasatum]